MQDTHGIPLVILGLDAGDPGFIRKWAQQGYLPTIASIMERGCWGETGGRELISEHGVWVSLFSGISRGEHGYYYFRQLVPGTYDLQPVSGEDFDVSPFWSNLSDNRKSVAIIDVPDIKLLPGRKGVQLVNWAMHDTWNPNYYQTATEPPELLREIHREFGEKLPSVEELDSTYDRDISLHQQLLHHVKCKGALCRHLLGRARADLTVAVFAESHAANHQFWKYCEEVNDQVTTENVLTHAIRDVYQAIDRELGLLLDELGGEPNVVILSSVGMEDDYPTTGLMEAVCRELGYQLSPTTNGRSLRPLDVARRILPKHWRIALSRHLPWSRREKLMADLFRTGTNWRASTAFAIPALYTSFVRVNLRGREPDGIVEPGREYQELLGRIEADLMQLTDAATGEPAVTRVVRTVEMFQCEPHVLLPDLFVEWKSGRYMGKVEHPDATISIDPPEFFRRSDHSSVGFVAAAGPSVLQRGKLGTVEVLDLAPTFLAMMNEPVPGHMSGHVMQDIIRDS